jgi:hypothetical protein
MKRYLIVIILFFFSFSSFAQEKAILKGKVLDYNRRPIEFAFVGSPATGGSETDRLGNFEFKINPGDNIPIVFQHIEFKYDTIYLTLKPGEVKVITRKLEEKYHEFGDVDIHAKSERANTVSRIPPKTFQLVPTPSGSFESALVGQFLNQRPDATSQYTVRGGNFDENLVYVNDIEIFRPFLVRSGKQEGLSFVNPDMVSSVLFSAGGFEAKYGDKMSSVLDIKYRKPTEFAASGSISFLGGTMHVEGATDNHRFTHITGIRYKTSKYMLNSMETKGEYNPSFFDLQTYMTYDLGTDFELSFLGNMSQNTYTFIPEYMETSFGSVHQALKLKVYFDGHEKDQFSGLMGALAGTYRPTKNKQFKFIASAFNTQEQETYDIQGQYLINELDRNLGSEEYGDSLMNIGIGTYLNHARNYLDATIYNFSHKGIITNDDNMLIWGAKLQHEIINDMISEWQMIDSSGYSLPYSDSEVNLFSTLNASNNLHTNRVTAYLQDNYTFERDSNSYSITFGVRGHYWDYNKQIVVSPRLNLAFLPNWNNHDILFRLSAGYYYQPPFYKELRDLEGTLHNDVKAQQSIHVVLGADYNFKIWGRPFKYITEIYYKKLNYLNPYLIEQVQIRYFADNSAVGYVAGMDMKINGEFVRGVDSWASLGVMRAMEDVEGDDYFRSSDSTTVHQGYIPRPSDQLVNFSLFFQDYIPNHPSYKVHLTLFYATGLPYGPPKSLIHRTALRMSPYRRVDIGFSKEIVSELEKTSMKNPFSYCKSIWIGLEVFNLLDINNTISYQWVTDIYGRQISVPNYLTSRRLNLRIVMKF